MTVIKLVQELLAIIEAEPHKANVEVFGYVTADTHDDPGFDAEMPLSVELVDNSISDRVDINF